MAFWDRLLGHQELKLKTIDYRGVVTFRIPESWKEEYSEMAGGTFYDERQGSGTLRLMLISALMPEAVSARTAYESLRDSTSVPGPAEALANGNALAKFERTSLEQGHRVKIVFWTVNNAVPPRKLRTATFSYAFLESQSGDKRILSEIELLDREIRRATFVPI